jgi:alanyl-tRNA synthetase
MDFIQQKGQSLDINQFKEAFEKHKELSRTASAGRFKGGLSDKSEEVAKLHTATHLLHAALRKVLGNHVSQKGSNITAERLRFDFSHPQKLTDEELKKVENLLNKEIVRDLPVSFETKSLDEAISGGALHFFAERYGDKVKVYTIGDTKAGWFSKEVCGGPHVSSTGVIGRVKIFKQEKVGSGVVRVYATTGSSKL